MTKSIKKISVHQKGGKLNHMHPMDFKGLHERNAERAMPPLPVGLRLCHLFAKSLLSRVQVKSKNMISL